MATAIQLSAVNAAIRSLLVASEGDDRMVKVAQRLALSFRQPGVACELCGQPASKTDGNGAFQCAGCAGSEMLPFPSSRDLEAWELGPIRDASDAAERLDTWAGIEPDAEEGAR